ncbi:MAG: hypothetical protein GBAus27B_000405 [Mycoplasmataceae bacterium]|nr:MAG: hypothetical protein GBAus27B_000405 [Mycoplasmataceae bacterium]
MAQLLEEKTTFDRFNRRKGETLNREELEYSAQKLFTGATFVLTAVAVYASVIYLVIKQLRKD